MAGAIAIVVVLLVIPVVFLISMGFVAGLLGQLLTSDGDARNEGSELVELNR